MNAVAAANPEAIPREDLMTLRHHFQSHLDAVRREGRHRALSISSGMPAIGLKDPSVTR